MQGMNSKHRKTLEAIFAKPVTGTIEWSRIEALLIAVGCEVIEGRGSRVARRSAPSTARTPLRKPSHTR